MSAKQYLPMDDPTDIPNPSETKLEAEQTFEEVSIMVVVKGKKTLLHEIKTKNKAGRLIMQIHEPRIRYNTGDTLKVHPEEFLTDGDVVYYRSFDDPELYIRKRDVALGGPTENQSQSEVESGSTNAAKSNFITVAVTGKKALLHEIKTKNKAGRFVMRIHEPRIRYNTGDTLKVIPEELFTDGNVIYYQCFDQPDLYIQKDDVG